MKKIASILLFCFVLIANQGISQTNTSIDDLLERLNINHMGSISDVFTATEILQLENHFKMNAIDVVTNRNLGDFIFSTEDQTSTFGKFAIMSPAVFNFLSTSPAPDFEGAGAYDVLSDTFLIFDSSNNIWEVDPLTGGYFNLGPVVPPAGETFVGLEFNPQDGRLYALSTDGVQTTLSEIDEETFAVTVVGVTGMTLGIALGIDLGGIAYSYDIDDDNLYSLSLSTGIKSLKGSIGFDANFGQGLTRDSSTGNMYMIALNNAGLDAQLRMVNTTTGNTTLIGSIMPGPLSHFGWGSFQQNLLELDDNEIVNFKIYPNPAANSLNLEAAQNIQGISIYNMQGQRILHQNIDALNARVDISFLASGQYICSAIINNQRGVYKFVKQ